MFFTGRLEPIEIELSQGETNHLTGGCQAELGLRGGDLFDQRNRQVEGQRRSRTGSFFSHGWVLARELQKKEEPLRNRFEVVPSNAKLLRPNNCIFFLIEPFHNTQVSTPGRTAMRSSHIAVAPAT